jgi:hypothetical protein
MASLGWPGQLIKYLKLAWSVLFHVRCQLMPALEQLL